MSSVERSETVRESLALRWFARGLLAAAAFCLFEVALIVAYGGAWTWNRFLHAMNPYSRLGVAAITLFGWYLLRHGLRNSAREWARFFGRLVLCSFSVGVALSAAEIALRIYLKRAQNAQSLDNLGRTPASDEDRRIRSGHPLSVIIRKSDNPRVVYELMPNLDRDFGHHGLRTNSQGMRDSGEYPVERRTNSVRIVGIGDSGMFGWECEQDENYMAVLESNLNRRADGVLYEVLNMGVPGYNTHLEVESLRAKGLRYKPDIVVVGWCNNDFQLPFFVAQEGQWDRRDVSFLMLLLFDRQAFADVAAGGVKDQRDYDKTKVPEFFRAGADVEGVRRSFLDLKALGEKEGFHIYVIGNMRREAVEIVKGLGIHYFNTGERIPKGQYPAEFSVYEMHPRPGGHRVLAEHLEKELDQLGWLKPTR